MYLNVITYLGAMCQHLVGLGCIHDLDNLGYLCGLDDLNCLVG